MRVISIDPRGLDSLWGPDDVAASTAAQRLARNLPTPQKRNPEKQKRKRKKEGHE
jgi:hypothetical protein